MPATLGCCLPSRTPGGSPAQRPSAEAAAVLAVEGAARAAVGRGQGQASSPMPEAEWGCTWCQLTGRLLCSHPEPGDGAWLWGVPSGSRARGAEQCPGPSWASQGVPGSQVGCGRGAAWPLVSLPFRRPCPRPGFLCVQTARVHMCMNAHLESTHAHMQARHRLPSDGMPLPSPEKAGGGLGPHWRGRWAGRGRHPWWLGRPYVG